MSFESLSERYDFMLSGYPEEWLPLTYLYDADLPLFPLYYFHRLDPELKPAERPRPRDRVYGFVRNLSLVSGGLRVSVVLNKDLSQPSNTKYREVVEEEVKARLGLDRRISISDIESSLKGELTDANRVLKELWHKIVDDSFGKALPFGRIWDGTFGLPRFIASWNSDGGRKGELIQTHYYMTAFGERISCGQGVHVDFYLLPTFEEVQDKTNPLNAFPRFDRLIRVAEEFVGRYCDDLELSSGAKLSAFQLKRAAPTAKRLDTDAIVEIMNKWSGPAKEALFENYNAFNRGPPRTVLSLLMHHDLRNKYWDPMTLSPQTCADMYAESKGSYQSPKVMQLYAQQCFGSEVALPIDNWVKTFLRWPLGFDELPRKTYFQRIFASSDSWGKVERLIWMASQARKVHSSVAAEILWCVRYGSANRKMRGANPLSCKICEHHIRDACPAYSKVSELPVAFNGTSSSGFSVETSAGNNTDQHQAFLKCEGQDIEDVYSARDRVSKFKPYPAANHAGENLSVKEFIEIY